MENNHSTDYLLDLKLYVAAQRDVFILLTPTPTVTNETTFLEFGKKLYFSSIFLIIHPTSFLFRNWWKQQFEYFNTPNAK